MSSSGIRRKGATVAKKIYLPEELAGKVELLIADPIRQKPKYGALSVLVSQLLLEYIHKLEQADAEPSSTPLHILIKEEEPFDV